MKLSKMSLNRFKSFNKSNRTTSFLAVPVLLALFGLGMTACGQNKNDSASSRNSVSGTATGPTNPLGYQEKGAPIVSRTAQGSVPNLSQNIIDMLSARVNPDAIGYIDEQSAIVAAYIEGAANGAINQKPSRIRLWVTDSYARDQLQLEDGTVAKPFYIEMNEAVSGSVTANAVTATFRNEERELTLQATINGNIASGSLSFRNLKDSAGGTLKSAQPMGYFVTETCALTNCRK